MIRCFWEESNNESRDHKFIIPASEGNPKGKNCRCCDMGTEEEKAACHCHQPQPEIDLLAPVVQRLKDHIDSEVVKKILEQHNV